MKATQTSVNLPKRLAIIAAVVAALLLIPFVAMQFTKEVNWDETDFIVMGALLFITGLGIEIVTRKVKSTNAKIGLVLGILFILFLIWAELAVGIFGSPFAGS